MLLNWVHEMHGRVDPNCPSHPFTPPTDTTTLLFVKYLLIKTLVAWQLLTMTHACTQVCTHTHIHKRTHTPTHIYKATVDFVLLLTCQNEADDSPLTLALHSLTRHLIISRFPLQTATARDDSPCIVTGAVVSE